MIRLYAFIFGIGFLIVSYLEYFQITETQLLFGYFLLSTTYFYPHLAAGAFGVLAISNFSMAKVYFLILGFFYVIIAILGFVLHGDITLISMQTTSGDNMLHAVMGAMAWYFYGTAEE